MSELHTAEQLHGSDVQWSTLKCWQHDDIYRASSSVLVLPRQYDHPIPKAPLSCLPMPQKNFTAALCCGSLQMPPILRVFPGD